MKSTAVTTKLKIAKTICQKTLPTVNNIGYLASWRGDSRPAISRRATTTDVIRTDSDNNAPTIPIMPTVNARPCQNVRDVAPQMRLSARSITAKTHEPAQITTTTQVMITPVPTDESERTVSRRNLPEPG